MSDRYINLPKDWNLDEEYWIEFPPEMKLSKYKIFKEKYENKEK